MPRVRPLGPNPQDRPNWDSMNEGKKRYAMEQWKIARVRRGKYFNHNGEEDQGITQEEAIANFDIDLLGSPQQPQEEERSNSQEEDGAVDDFLNQIRNNQNNREMEHMDVVSSSQGSSQGTSSSSQKRPTSTGGGQPPKKGKVAKSGTSLPGTGGNLDGMSGGAVS